MRCRNITSQAKQRYSSGYARIAKNADFFNEVNASALGKIGTNYVLETVKKEHLLGSFHFRIYSTGIFENIKTPESEAVVLDILPKEKDITLKTMLTNGLCRLLFGKFPGLLQISMYSFPVIVAVNDFNQGQIVFAESVEV